MSQEFVVAPEEAGVRIDRYLSDQCQDISRSYLQKLLKEQSVLVEEKPVKSNYKVNAGDRISLTLPEIREPEIMPEEIPLDIVYEDKDIILINKPKGMVVHPAAGHYSGTLVNGLMSHCRSELSGINGVMRPGIVHRLDKNTSGMMLVAKNDKSHNFLAKCLKEHSINRIYYALVEGNIRDDNGVVDASLGRSEKDRKKRTVTTKNSKNAITNYWVVERYGKYTLLKLKLQTGRTHQIRVHMRYIGHPVVGDDIYGSKTNKFGLNGQLLHSKSVGFIHPSTGEYMEFDSELPEYFSEVLRKIRG
ncbi:MAG TPA: RNA pseudouridine synthase [Clostridiales bacterium]|nr:RNA pseudouridine synthase [Clostridiales bacterium]